MARRLTEAEERQWRAYLHRIRAGRVEHPDPLRELTRLACRTSAPLTVAPGVSIAGYDVHTLHRAAITGLAAHAQDPCAVVGIAERVLDIWGVTTLRHGIRVLGQLADRGGLIVLSSTLWLDVRVVDDKDDKVQAMRKALWRSGEGKSTAPLDRIYALGPPRRAEGQQWSAEWTGIVRSIGHQDIKQGALFGAQYEDDPALCAELVAVMDPGELAHATGYVEARLPGLAALYDRLHPSRLYRARE